MILNNLKLIVFQEISIFAAKASKIFFTLYSRPYSKQRKQGRLRFLKYAQGLLSRPYAWIGRKYKFISDSLSVLNFRIQPWQYYFSTHIGDPQLLNNLTSFTKSISPKVILCVIPLVRSNNNRYISLHRQVFMTRSTDATTLFNFINFRVELLANQYNLQEVDMLVLKYRRLIHKPEDLGKFKDITQQFRDIRPSVKNYVALFRGNPYDIPISNNINDYGVLTDLEKVSPVTGKSGYYFSFKNKFVLLCGDLKSPTYNVVGEIYNENHEFLGKFTDTVSNYILTRVYLDDKIEIKLDIPSNTIICFSYKLSCKFIPIPVKSKSPALTSKILTLDIETFVDAAKQSIFAIGWSDGKIVNCFKLPDYSTVTNMLTEFFNSMLTASNNYATVYCHNLSNFDIVFIYKHLASNFNISPIYRDNKLIKISISNKEFNLTILDSYLILPISLKDLAISFYLESNTASNSAFGAGAGAPPYTKTNFPYTFLTRKNFNYKGPTPDITYFNNISVEEYSKLVKPNWDLQEEVIEYLKNDLLTLHGVILTFYKFILNNFNVNITMFATMPGISVYTWQTKFAKYGNIPVLDGRTLDFVTQGYYGGMNFVLIPKGTNVYIYDVNSKYPDAANSELPLGPPYYVKSKNLSDYGVGFVRVKITAPYMWFPVVPYRSDKGIIYPYGTWEGVYSTYDVEMMRLLGYEVEIIEGIGFKETAPDIFKDYMVFMYEKKEKSTGAARVIYKLMLNSFTGRLGLNENDQITEVLNDRQLNKIFKKHKIINSITLSPNKNLTTYEKKVDESLGKFWDDHMEEYINNSNTNKPGPQSIRAKAHAALITSLSRCSLIYSTYNLIKKKAILYVDTDSVTTTLPLNPVLVGRGLGQFKEEFKDVNVVYGGKKIYTIYNEEKTLAIKARSIPKNLLTKENIIDIQEGKTVFVNVTKWYKDIQNSTIINKELNIKITPPEIGREKVYSLGEWVNTKPYYVKNGVISTTAIVEYTFNNKISNVEVITNKIKYQILHKIYKYIPQVYHTPLYLETHDIIVSDISLGVLIVYRKKLSPLNQSRRRATRRGGRGRYPRH